MTYTKGMEEGGMEVRGDVRGEVRPLRAGPNAAFSITMIMNIS